MRILEINIKNYRCFKNLNHNFNDSNMVCLIGRGDSGKTTILDAIYAVLSPKWNHSFTDTDFHNLELNNDIEIQISILNPPEKLLSESKYGLHQRFYKNNQIFDELSDNPDEENESVLTIKLIVKKDLEPKWFVVNERSFQDEKEITAKDRALFHAYYLSDYIDSHLSLSKGSPFLSLMNKLEDSTDFSIVFSELNYSLKQSIKEQGSFSRFDDLIDRVSESAIRIGLNPNDLEAFVDFKNSIIKEGNISIHENSIPFRLKGKGTKRLLSIAIQLELVNDSKGFVLIDEIEQGLEPDRARFLSRTLKDKSNIQSLITTHSSNVIQELSFDDIKLNRNESLLEFDVNFSKTLLDHPESFFAKSILVCEGKTELGIIKYLVEENNINLPKQGKVIIDGHGDTWFNYSKHLEKCGFSVSIFMDSDNTEDNSKKNRLTSCSIIDCDDGNAIENQIFKDLNWESVIEISKKFKLTDFIDVDSEKNRESIGRHFKKRKTFKKLEAGKYLGKFFNKECIKSNTKLSMIQKELISWLND